MKYSNNVSRNSPLYSKLRGIYELKKHINNSTMPEHAKQAMMKDCDREANQAWRNHYAGVAGYELVTPRPMAPINTILRKEYGVKTASINDERLHAESDSMVFLVVAPHDEMKKWLLRIAPRSTFDRWANSVVIERQFDNVASIANWLKMEKMFVFMKVLNSLSNEVVDMKREMEENE